MFRAFEFCHRTDPTKKCVSHHLLHHLFGGWAASIWGWLVVACSGWLGCCFGGRFGDCWLVGWVSRCSCRTLSRLCEVLAILTVVLAASSLLWTPLAVSHLRLWLALLCYTALCGLLWLGETSGLF